MRFMLYLSSDVGGTFTDLVLMDTDAGRTFVDKVPSTGRSVSGIIHGIGRILKKAERPIGELSGFIHGSTIATNAWLTRRGSNAVLLVTQGFRDILEIANQRREKNYALSAVRPPALVPRSKVIEVVERVDAFGDIVVELTQAEIERVIDNLRRLEADAVAISLLFSFKNNVHERRLAQAIRNEFNRTRVYVSSAINPQLGEYLRTNTTAAAAYVGPELDGYVASLNDGLADIGFASPLMLMRSDGGVATPEAVRENPATMLLSGPSGGVICSAALGEAIGVRNLVTFDMGGTSADFSLIAEGEPRKSTERIIRDQVLRLPMLDIETISAGGGSIATVDHAGALYVGPQSAGAEPGPACYGKGGRSATLTDAAVLLGILDPLDFAGGDIALDVEAAREVIRSEVARPLNLSVEDAAFGMIAVACSQMRQAIRALTIERGHDLRQFSLLAFGGAGAIFAAFMEKDLGVEQVLIPPRPGVFAALGLLLADIRHNAQAVYMAGLDDLDGDDVSRRLTDLRRGLDAAFDRDGVDAERRSYGYSADLRYQGQFHDINVPLDAPECGPWSSAAIADRFHRLHDQAYGHCDPSSPAEIVNLRVEAVGRVDKPSFSRLDERASGLPVARSSRRIILGSGGVRQDCPVYLRNDLLPGHAFEGPAIVSQSDTTVLVLPGQAGTVDDYGVIRIRSKGHGE